MSKKVYVSNIEKETLENKDYRRVLFTSNYSQLVVMSLAPGEEIGTEVHGLDQFIRIEKGEGKAVLDGKDYEVIGDWAFIVPAGVKHNLINTSDKDNLKLYSIYSPPEHKEGTIHKGKGDEKEEHFDGMTSQE